MTRFQVSEETRRTQNYLEGTFVLLKDLETNSRAEIWPALGFNCVRWLCSTATGPMDWLYATPQLLDETRPTRSGIPILFPFPNRIRDGRFSWQGKSYRLPLNDPTQKNAIHGFACRHLWRVTDGDADAESAWVKGEFWASRDAPEVLSLWPADHKIQITYRLRAGSLSIEAVVENPDHVPLPFGLGYHPYFRLPATPEQTLVEVPAQQSWELVECLPINLRLPVNTENDLRRPRTLFKLNLDDVLTDLELPSQTRIEGQRWCGSIRSADNKKRLDLYASPAFREFVVFTPPHRQAFCLEPYTCVTDAINLQANGIDAGWLVLDPGKRWTATVTLVTGSE